MVQQLNSNLIQKAITLSVTEDAKKWILEKTLVDRTYGARPLRRALQRYVEDPLSEALDRWGHRGASCVPQGVPSKTTSSSTAR